jgi:hypothetical protein
LTAGEKRLMQTKKMGTFPLFSNSYHTMGISPLEPDTNRGTSYYPSKTSGFPIANRTNNNNESVSGSNNNSRNQSREGGQRGNNFSANANALLSSFRPESLQTKTEWQKVQDERQYQTIRANHMRELEKALTSSSPRRNGNL